MSHQDRRSPESSSPAGGTRVLLGTCSWSADGWKSVFYPHGTASSDYLTYYARHFPTVEIDSTFYAIPPESTVRQWRDRTPPGFQLAAKVPRIVTHDKVMVDAGADLNRFCQVMEPLGDRLGPLLLQFPYFKRDRFGSAADFRDRLRPFLDQLPTGFDWALEIRNRRWLDDPLLDLLRARGVALALIDHPYMPQPDEWEDPAKLVTAPFSYVRWLGDRYGIEKLTTTFDRKILDKSAELRKWADALRTLPATVDRVYAYANNHYAGHSPSTLRDFDRIWGGGLLNELPDEPDTASRQPPLGLFD